MIIRDVKLSDASAIAEIYNHYIFGERNNL